MLRELLDLPFVGAEELTRFMLICVVFVTLPYVVASGANIRLEEGLNLMPHAVQARRSTSLIAATGACRFAVAAAAIAVATLRNLQNATPTLGIPYWVFFSAAFFGLLFAAVEIRAAALEGARPPARPTSPSPTRPRRTTWTRSRRLSSRRRTGRRRNGAMTVLLLGAFTILFLLGWPVVLAVMIPAVAYVLWNGFPIELVGQRMAYALDSFPLVAVPVFIFVGNLMNQSGITEVIYRFATTLVGRASRAGSPRSTSSAA